MMDLDEFGLKDWVEIGGRLGPRRALADWLKRRGSQSLLPMLGMDSAG